MLIQQSGWSVPQAAKALGYSEGHVYRWKRGAEIPRKSVMTLLKMQLKALQPDECGSEFRLLTFVWIDLRLMLRDLSEDVYREYNKKFGLK